MKVLEIRVNGEWVQVTKDIFRSWTGLRRVNMVQFHGPVFYLGTNEVARTT